MFQGLPNGEFRERISVGLDKLPDGISAGPGILSQGPPNGLANEELLFIGHSYTQLEQQALVCVPLIVELRMNERAVLEGITVLLVLLEAEFRTYIVDSC